MISLFSTLKNKYRFVLSTFILGLLASASFAQVSAEQLAGLKYRMIGPHRAGRTVGISGVADQPNIFYIGVNNGGVWKTTDYGHTWKPFLSRLKCFMGWYR